MENSLNSFILIYILLQNFFSPHAKYCVGVFFKSYMKYCVYILHLPKPYFIQRYIVIKKLIGHLIQFIVLTVCFRM